jgi:hypothetical protein
VSPKSNAPSQSNLIPEETALIKAIEGQSNKINLDTSKKLQAILDNLNETQEKNVKSELINLIKSWCEENTDTKNSSTMKAVSFISKWANESGKNKSAQSIKSE